MGFVKYSNTLGRKSLCKNGIHSLVASSKEWSEPTSHRRLIRLDDNSVTRVKNLVEVDMSAYVGKPTGADWTNYVRVYEHLDATEVGTEINSQPYDKSWSGGNHDSVAFLCTGTDTKSYYTIYFGDVNLGAPGYTSDLTVTANVPAAGDYTVQQDDFYKMEIDFSRGGELHNDVWTRVSGGNVQISGWFSYPSLNFTVGGTVYSNSSEINPTITLIEGTTGANAGAVFVAFKITGNLEDAAHNPLANTSYELIFVFCNSQLIYTKNSIIITDSINNVTLFQFLHSQNLNGYFSHQGYKYGSTHAVEVVQDRDLSVNISTIKYFGFFDITSNDGLILHFTNSNRYTESPLLSINDDVGTDDFIYRPDTSGTNTTYTAAILYEEIWIQIDDFTEADGNNDEFGDAPANRKNTELLTALDQHPNNEVSF